MKYIFIIIFFNTIILSEFIRDDNLNIVIDTSRSLIWKNDTTLSTNSWETVINPLALSNNKCANMIFSGYSDWRLANINELKTIIDYTQTDPAINNVFINIPSSSNGYINFLSSTTSVPSNTVWYVNFWDGSISSIEKDGTQLDENMYFFCVRNR